MSSYYLDTSALVKLYFEEEGTAGVVDLIRDAEIGRIIILEIALLEFRSALRRKERRGDISAFDANSALARLEQQAASLYRVESLTPTVANEAARLIDLYPLRTYDAVQLAGCLAVRSSVLPPLTFVCADYRLCAAANLEGVATINPLDER
jgi:predicted nucleic acid-binding protein